MLHRKQGCFYDSSLSNIKCVSSRVGVGNYLGQRATSGVLVSYCGPGQHALSPHWVGGEQHLGVGWTGRDRGLVTVWGWDPGQSHLLLHVHPCDGCRFCGQGHAGKLPMAPSHASGHARVLPILHGDCRIAGQ